MSLRTVALDTPRPRERAIVCDPTGCAVEMCSSTMARRIGGLPLVELHWHSILPSASREGPALECQQEPGGDLVAEEPAPAREDGPVARPGQETDVDELVDARDHAVRIGLRARKLDPTGGAQRPGPWSPPRGRRGRGSRSRPRSRCPPAPRRCSARACGRSTTGDRRCGRGRHSRWRRSHRPPSRGGCGGTRRRGGPSSRSRTRRGRRRPGGRRPPRTSWPGRRRRALPAGRPRPPGRAGYPARR